MQRVEHGAKFGDNEDQTTFDRSSATHIYDDVADLHRQLSELSKTIGELNNSIRAKDVHLENIQRDNERLASELKKQQRCNRNLKQQLDDERFFYQKEKEHFCQEMENSSAKGSVARIEHRHKRKLEKLRESLENENRQLKDEILEKSEITYNLCIKFLRMKDSRDSLRQKLDRLLQEHLQVMAEMMEKLDEAREELNIIVSEKFQEPLPISKAKFLQVVQRNSKLVYENATLKLHVQQLTMNIEKLKAEAQKTKTINVDARTIEKLTECSRRRRSEEATRNIINTPSNVGKGVATSKSSVTTDSQFLDKSASTRVAATIRSRSRCKLGTDSSGSPLSEKMHFCPDRVRSDPGIIRSSEFREISDVPSSNFTDESGRNVKFCDAGTNT